MIQNAGTNPEYHGQKVFESVRYKTSSVYSEKLIAALGALLNNWNTKSDFIVLQ